MGSYDTYGLLLHFNGFLTLILTLTLTLTYRSL